MNRESIKYIDVSKHKCYLPTKIYILRSLTPKKCFKMSVYVPYPWKFVGPKRAQKIMHRFYSNLLKPCISDQNRSITRFFETLKSTPIWVKKRFFFFIIFFLNSEFEITMSAFQWTCSYFKNDENRFRGWGWIEFEKKLFLSTFVPNAVRPQRICTIIIECCTRSWS